MTPPLHASLEQAIVKGAFEPEFEPHLAPAAPPKIANRHVGRRRFLIVTAPFGPFSRRLAQAMRRAGADCERVLLNGGDAIDWGLAHATAYRGDFAGWRGWIAEHLANGGFTDLIVHGDTNPYGSAAIEQAQALELEIHVFEQGYFRPHWITLEPNGVNARSTLPRGREHYEQIGWAPCAPPKEAGRVTAAAVRWITRYHVFVYLGAVLFPRYRNPYMTAPARQALGHVLRYIRQRLQRRSQRAMLSRLIEGERPLFLVLLQRPGDSQLTRHSSFARLSDFIDEVVDSFAAHAPAAARLLFKAHPLDHGLERLDLAVASASARARLGSRVAYAEEGHLPTMLERCCGVICVNSSGGLSGLEFGAPTLTLGEAIYDMAGLTHQGGLDSFWTSPERPDRDLFLAYRAAVIASRQVNGAFSTDEGMALAIPEALRRLMNGQAVNRPAVGVAAA